MEDKTEEVIGYIRKNGMRYAGRTSDGKEVIHTPFLNMSFNQAAQKVKSEEICGYPAGALSIPSHDQLDVIRLSYSQPERNAIRAVWSRDGRFQNNDVFADLQYFTDGCRFWDSKKAHTQVCFVPK